MSETIITGHAGRIEANYVINTDNKNAPIAILFHPNPTHGGTMNNKVVYTMYKTLYEQGFSVLRFNFRGVGKSQGSYENGHCDSPDSVNALINDASTVLDWMKKQHEGASAIWVGGFSFGCLIEMQLLMRRPEISHFIAISPPANMYSFDFLAPCPRSGLVVQGDLDEIVPKASVDKLVDKISHQHRNSNHLYAHIEYKVISAADHYFQGKLDKLRSIITDHVQEAMAPPFKEVVNK